MISIVLAAVLFVSIPPTPKVRDAYEDRTASHVVEIPDYDGWYFTSRGPAPSFGVDCWRIRHRSPLRTLNVSGHALPILYVVEESFIDHQKSRNCGCTKHWNIYVYGWQVDGIITDDGTTIARASSVIDTYVKEDIRMLLQMEYGSVASVRPQFFPDRSPPHIWYVGEYVTHSYFQRCRELEFLEF